MRHSHNFDIPDNTTHIYLFPAKSVSDAVTASILGMGSKALSVFIFDFIIFIALIGLFFGFVNLAGQEESLKNAVKLLEPLLPHHGDIITENDLIDVLPIIFVGTFTILLLPLCCDFVMFHLKRKEGRGGMKDEFFRRLRRNSLLIGMVFIFAIAMTPLAKYAEGTTALSMSGMLASLCLVALIANVFFVAFDTFANQLIWHAGIVFYRKFF